MNKKAKLREAAELKLSNVPNRILNMYLVPRKLLVFDINKVLLHRQAKSSFFKIRPHAYAFIAGMSQRYTLAVWTSMTKKSAKPILADLFPPQHIPLLFNWYQNRCHSIPNELVPDGKPLFLKELSRVWAEFSQFNESNTILLDDTSEKCARNPPHTSIQPCPYEPNGPRLPQFNPYIAPAFSIQNGSDNASSAVRVDIAVDKIDANEIDLDDIDVDVDQSAEATTTESDTLDVSPACESNSAVAVTVLGAEIVVEVSETTTQPCSQSPQLATSAINGEGVGSIGPLSASVESPEATILSSACVVTHTVPAAAQETVPMGPGEETKAVPSLPRAPPPAFFRPPPPPPMHGPPLPPQAAAVFNPYMTDEDCELIPGGPLWNYLDILARHDGPVQEIYEQLGPYRFY